ARVADHGIEPSSIGDELWTRRGTDESLCYAGSNLIPLRGMPMDMYAFADKALTAARRCSSVVGRAEFVLPMWRRLEHTWGPARAGRDPQPRRARAARRTCAIDGGVRRVRVDELEPYLVAAIDMFIGEVGIDPRLGDGGGGDPRRRARLLSASHARARVGLG